MKISARLLIFLIICTISAQFVKAEDANDLDMGQDSAVSIELTKFDVNDTTLELAWKIINNTDHDVWICDRSDFYDVYLDTDAKTLILRRRFNLPCKYVTKGFIGRYVRLRPGQEKIESISLDVPIKRSFVFQSLSSNAELATRLALEIGFYDEDLPGSILEIVDLAEKLNCEGSAISLLDPNSNVELYHRYFGGVTIEKFFNSEESFGYFRNSVTSGGDEILIPYMWQALNGEQVLRLDIDDVSIPIKDIINAPLENQDVEESAVSMELTHFEITDANLELGWNIKNNTDHDVWICDTINADNTSYKQLEVYMPKDEQILLIRRRLDVPTILEWAVHPRGRYVLLRSDQELNESLSLEVPIQPKRWFATGRATSDHARQLVLEIGFYNEDLPGMIRKIIEVEEKLNCASLEPEEYMTPLFMHYFKGIWIVNKFFSGGLSGFDKYMYQEGNEEIRIPYTWQNLGGEQVLRIEVDGVHIPYDEVNWDLGI